MILYRFDVLILKINFLKKIICFKKLFKKQRLTLISQKELPYIELHEYII
jgi:hypothetical protein